MPLNFDNFEFYSGGFNVVAQAMTGQAINNQTVFSTTSINHQVGYLPQGGTQNVPTLGVGEEKLLLVEVITAGTQTTTVSLYTDTVAAMNSTEVSLASLTIPTTAVAGTIYALAILPTMAFQACSALQYVTTGTITLAAWFATASGVQASNNYQSGWVVENS